jgi:hypothetical protein
MASEQQQQQRRRRRRRQQMCSPRPKFTSGIQATFLKVTAVHMSLYDICGRSPLPFHVWTDSLFSVTVVAMRVNGPNNVLFSEYRRLFP